MIKRLFGSVIDVRRGEYALTFIMLAYYYLLLVTYYFLKPARDSLFLVKLGAEQLPIVFMAIAVIVVPITTLYSSASRSLKLNRLINITQLIVIANLVILRVLLESTHPLVFYAFYIWVSIYGVLTTSQFWLLANGVFDATQAKRIFVLIGLAGILGAYTGGEVTGFITKSFGVSTENLLFFCMAFLAVCVLLANVAWRRRLAGAEAIPGRRTRAEPKESQAETFKMIKRSRHLMLIVGIIAATMATASFVDYQFKAVATAAFPDKQALTAFLGKFYGRMSLVSFIFQFALSYRILRWFGVGGAILLLPLGLLAGTFSMLAFPGLIAGVLLRGADGVFKYSIDKTGRELLFLPVPLAVKKRTKVFIDIFVDRWFRGIAGAVLLLVVALGFSVRQISLVVLALLALWFVMVFFMRKEYVNAFRMALERREIDLNDIRISISEASTLEALRASLASGNERQVVYALEMLGGVQDAEIAGAVKPLLVHGSTEVRRSAVKMLARQRDPAFLPEMRQLMQDADPAVRRDALYYICEHDEGDREGLVTRFLHDSDVTTRAAAVGMVAEYGGPREHQMVDGAVIKGIVESDGPTAKRAREEVAKALGAINRAEFKSYLLRLMQDDSHAVATEAIRGAGRTADRDFLNPLTESLRDARLRPAAREALAAFGDRIVGTLSDFIIEPRTNIAIRSNLCRVLARIPTQHSVETLVATLNVVEPEMKYHVIKALNSLRVRHPELKFSHQALNDALIDETESYYAILQIIRVESAGVGPGPKLLTRALREKIDQNLERMFRLLALSYSSKDIYGAYVGLVGTKKELRATAIEFLDNVLRKNVKRYLFPIVDNITDDFKIQKGNELFGLKLQTRSAALEYLLKGRDPWLKTCALYSMRGDMPNELRGAVEHCEHDPHPVVQETARLVLAAS